MAQENKSSYTLHQMTEQQDHDRSTVWDYAKPADRANNKPNSAVFAGALILPPLIGLTLMIAGCGLLGTFGDLTGIHPPPVSILIAVQLAVMMIAWFMYRRYKTKGSRTDLFVALLTGCLINLVPLVIAYMINRSFPIH